MCLSRANGTRWSSCRTRCGRLGKERLGYDIKFDKCGLWDVTWALMSRNSSREFTG
jgi:hypothetical protein